MSHEIPVTTDLKSLLRLFLPNGEFRINSGDNTFSLEPNEMAEDTDKLRDMIEDAMCELCDEEYNGEL